VVFPTRRSRALEYARREVRCPSGACRWRRSCRHYAAVVDAGNDPRRAVPIHVPLHLRRRHKPGNGIEYVDFLVPGFLVTAILWPGMPSAAGVAEDAATGVHDRMRSLPIPRSSVIVGRSLADTALTLWGALIATVLAFIVGFRLNANIAEVALALVVLLAASYSFMWVYITIGLTSKSAQAANGTASILIVPLAFVSAAYVPADTLPG
jgi:ABC-type multidrug transport system permease subunit